MKPTNDELDNFNAGMMKLLRANPAVVREAMEQEKQEREKERKAKRSSCGPASSDHKV
jgi:hypothetical protein